MQYFRCRKIKHRPKITPELRIANITVNKKSKQPLYQQFYDGVRTAIPDGTIRPGERLL